MTSFVLCDNVLELARDGLCGTTAPVACHLAWQSRLKTEMWVLEVNMRAMRSLLRSEMCISFVFEKDRGDMPWHVSWRRIFKVDKYSTSTDRGNHLRNETSSLHQSNTQNHPTNIQCLVRGLPTAMITNCLQYHSQVHNAFLSAMGIAIVHSMPSNLPRS